MNFTRWRQCDGLAAQTVSIYGAHIILFVTDFFLDIMKYMLLTCNFQVKVVAETRGQEHADEIHAALKANYKQVSWGPVHF